MRHLLLNFLLLLILPILLHCAAPATSGGPKDGFLGDAAALDALRRTLNSTAFDSWIGLPCIGDDTTWTGLTCINFRVVSIVLEGLGLSGRIDDPLILSNLTELYQASFKNNSITGVMFSFSMNPNLVWIDLSMNQFAGPISGSLLGLTRLESLQLQHNNLSGSIPPLSQTGLKVFDVSYNKLTGHIPNTSALQSFDESSYSGNPGLCGPPGPDPCPTHVSVQPPNKVNGSDAFSKSSLLVAIFIIVDVVGLFALLWAVYTSCKRAGRRGDASKETERVEEAHQANYVEAGDKDKSEEKAEEVAGEGQRKVVFVSGGDRGFDLDDLLRAPAESLGKGCIGASFKVVLDDDRPFVVKRLRDVSPLTDEEFADRVGVILGMEHPNLFPPIGYYYAMDEKLLVYEWVPNGSLYDRINGRRGDGSKTTFKWNARLLVAKHIARAMDLLHRNTEGGPDTVPHGNLKSSNVLLLDSDGAAAALVCDYGLAPLIPRILAPNRLSVYQTPEYQHGRSICRKSDVWSFGCLLLELVTRKLPAANSGQAGLDGAALVSWVHRAVREEWTAEVFDVEMAGTHNREAMQGMFKLLQVALWCCEPSLSKRPEMAEVAREVEGIMACDDDEDADEEETPTPTPGRWF